MILHHLRNATLVIESGDHLILVDPMLGPKGSLPPFAKKRFPAQDNPLVDLPPHASALLERVTHCLITHSQKWGIRALQHTDHLDQEGESFLKKREIPVTTLSRDAKVLRTYGLNIANGLEAWQEKPFLGGSITAVPARHGHSWVHHLMANGAGYVIQLPNEPRLYLSGDTVLTPDVERALEKQKPEVSVIAGGTATLDFSTPILMTLEEMTQFVQKAPGKVVVNHLEALNHCPTTRSQVQKEMEAKRWSDRVFIPEDGETLQV